MRESGKAKAKAKIVFLDIDGVLTSTEETPGSYINHEPSEYGPSPSCVARVLALCQKSGAKVIFSTNWRNHPLDGPCSFWVHNSTNGHKKVVYNPLPEARRQLGDVVVGTLPPIRHATKAEALILWFEENDLSQDDIDYVVIDDDPSENLGTTHEYGIKSHFVLTDYKIGMTDADVQKALEILHCK